MGRKAWASAGSVLFFILAPGTVVGLVPWWLTGWRFGSRSVAWIPVQVVGGLLLVSGVAVLVDAFTRFVREGAGTPAPVAPTRELVVGGLYRHVRNPMYLAVLAGILGQALLLVRPVLFSYALLVGLAVVTFVQWYEQPALRRQYGARYDAYMAAVPGWWPSWRGWSQPKETEDLRP
jgi:protein-S-isoprenylcysteine O-methyltransferase Ste14